MIIAFGTLVRFGGLLELLGRGLLRGTSCRVFLKAFEVQAEVFDLCVLQRFHDLLLRALLLGQRITRSRCFGPLWLQDGLGTPAHNALLDEAAAVDPVSITHVERLL